MKKILMAMLAFMPFVAVAQNTNDNQNVSIEQLQRDVQAKAEAAQKAAVAAQKAAEEAAQAAEKLQKANEATMQKADKVAKEADKAAQKVDAVTGATQHAEAPAQNDKWELPATPAPSQAVKAPKAAGKEDVDEDAPYKKAGAVPVVNGQVMWTKIFACPGLSAGEAYKRTLDYLTSLTQADGQLPGSKVAIVNPGEHSIVATMREWLTFRDNLISLDRAEFYYVLNATCTDGAVTLTMQRLTYKYDVQGKDYRYKAESWITDAEAVNKKHTRLLPISGKFRRETIKRQQVIFNGMQEALK